MDARVKEELANYLLNKCFLLGGYEQTRSKYYQVLNNREEFQALFRPLGYTLVLHPSPLKVIQLINNHEGNQERLLKYESIILLILRILYIQKRESLSSGEDWVIATVEEIEAEYNKMNVARKLDKRLLEAVFSRLRSFNLATSLDRLDNSAARVQIFPSVILAIPDNKIDWSCDQTRDFLAKYQKADPQDDFGGEFE